MSRTVGIDFGTTNSVIAVVGADGRPRVLEHEGERIIPSVVAIDEQGRLLVGRQARNYLPLDPDNAVHSVKRFIGTDQRFTLRGKEYSPQQIAALIMRTLRDLAESALGEPVKQAVITVPAYFTDQQRIATKEAGELAGLDVVRIINEPTAAALAYGIDQNTGQRALVYDLGGGTFDVSLVQIEEGFVEVLATAGNNRLGGNDFDQRIVDYVSDRFSRDEGFNIRQDPRALARLSASAEQAKIRLSDHPYARLREDFLATLDGKPLHLDQELSRTRFEELIADLLTDTIVSVNQVLRDADCRAKDIDKVLLVGGSTRIPAVRHILEAELQQEPSGDVHPDECVALGAAVQAAIVDGLDVDAVLVDVTAHSLGIAVAVDLGTRLISDRYSVIIPRNSVIPTEKAEVYTTTYDNQRAVDIRVFQGEHHTASSNERLGEFRLEGVPPRPAGGVEIIVTFSMDVDGILQVTAEERSTGSSANITVRDMRARMSAYEKMADEAAVTELWDPDASGTAATQALLHQAKSVAEEQQGEIAAEILAIVAEIEALLDEDLPDPETLADLEDELLEILEGAEENEENDE
jgi:molecular chaperone DnaK